MPDTEKVSCDTFLGLKCVIFFMGRFSFGFSGVQWCHLVDICVTAHRAVAGKAEWNLRNEQK